MTNILVTGAGVGGSNNLIRGLRRISPPVRLVGTNADRFSLARSTADVNYPGLGPATMFAKAIAHLAERDGGERISDLVATLDESAM